MGAVHQKLRDSARGMECTLRLPGICQGGTETTVLAHLHSGIGLKGTGMKVPDWWAVFACHACHDVLDRRRKIVPVGDPNIFLHIYAAAAVQRTWAIWFELGLLRVAGDAEKPRTKLTSNKIVARKPSWRITPIGSLDRPGQGEEE
jgi:hypothetical protein